MTHFLSPEHAASLATSAISTEVAEARGYYTSTTKAELRRLGFTMIQQQVPTLVVPVYNPQGENALFQHRPDTPRVNREGKAVKYETRAGSRMIVDVHPFSCDKVRDPHIPLVVTEGIKKADAATSAGLCCVGLLGVWNFRGTNKAGGKTALPDWEYIAFKDSRNAPRQVYLCFDSDAMLKTEVYAALCRLAAFLRQRGANVAFIYLPHGADGQKVGLDDYLAAGHTTDDLFALATSTLRPPPEDEDRTERELPYRATPAGLVHMKQTPSGPVAVTLTNFTARITGDVVEDDGAEARRFFEIEARRGERISRFNVSAATFSGMNWVTDNLGASAIVYPGQGTRDHARAAIQMLSSDPPLKHVYSHIGWREVSPGRWAFLHSGGGIGAEEPVQVTLSPALSRYALPDPPTGSDLRTAIRTELRLWSLVPGDMLVPLWCAVYRAPLGQCDFALHLAGPSGAFKSEVAALAQQHFGQGMDARHLPGAWSSTDNALEGLTFTTKDSIVVIDDFAPTGTANDVQRLHAKADRVFRGQGNGSGRGRMNADGTLRVTRYPRGLIVSTGEDIPTGLSLRARLLTLEVAPGMVDAAKLTKRQQEAALGEHAQAMSAYLAWLAPRYESVQTEMRTETLRLRSEAAESGQHRRTPDMVASLAAGLGIWLQFAEDVGAITDKERENLWQRGWTALGNAAIAQKAHLGASEPTRRYLELLSAAVASGRAHVAGEDGECPQDAHAWGWRLSVVGTGENERQEWRAQGERIGWRDGEDLFLEPDAAHAVAKRLGEGSGDGLSLNVKTLHKRLHERGLLASTEAGRGNTVRRTLEGRRREVLHLRADCLSAEAIPLAKTAQSAQTDQLATAVDGDTPPVGSFSGQIMAQATQETAQKTDQFLPTVRRDAPSDGQFGQIGQFSDTHIPSVVGAGDVRAFRRGMYNPDNDGTFLFDGVRWNADAAHTETQDKDALMIEMITAHRAQTRRSGSCANP